jgi:cellulose synthase/poly-beta-1,6-N-acetylglucosamine synthase-like glycosyltransferase
MEKRVVLTLQVLQVIHDIAAILLAVVGFHSIVLVIVYLVHQNKRPDDPRPVVEGDWPSVVVQLPIFNERHVVERLVEAVSQLDYPKARLEIQLLDDSTDDTISIASAAVERARQAGLSVAHVRRATREGYKAGALAYGLTQTSAEYAAIFDADFLPAPDFLRRLIPYFLSSRRLGMVQTRWSHLNQSSSLLTRAQALALDTHFVIEQTARHRGGLLMNFSGTAGIWRRETIEDAGGWDEDTLSEDIDLSYRAQLKGWECLYLPNLGTASEITPLMMGFKKQQARWATGTVQCLRKLGPTVLRSHLGIWQKIEAMFHLSAYLIHPLMIVLLLATLPLLLNGHYNNVPLASLGLAMFGPPLEMLIAQRRLYSDWAARISFFPMLMVLGVGISVSNTEAVARAFSPKRVTFHRTPKFQADSTTDSGWVNSGYTVPVDYTLLVEIFLAIYAAVSAVAAFRIQPEVAPFMILYALGFGYVAGLSVWQTGAVRLVQTRKRRVLELSDNKL